MNPLMHTNFHKFKKPNDIITMFYGKGSSINRHLLKDTQLKNHHASSGYGSCFAVGPIHFPEAKS